MEQQAPRRHNRNFPLAIQVIPATRFSKATSRLVSIADLHPSERPDGKRGPDPDLISANPAADIDPGANASAPLPAAPPAAANLPAGTEVVKEVPPAVTPAPAEVKPAQTKPDPSHHGRRCAICNHPHREAIEGDFLNWRSPQLIVQEFGIQNRASIYRHAGALNLYAQRKRQLGRVLENIIECSDVCTFDHCDMIIRAARVYAHLDDDGKWHEPPRTHYIFTGRISALSPARPSKPRRRRKAPRRKNLTATVPDSKKG